MIETIGRELKVNGVDISISRLDLHYREFGALVETAQRHFALGHLEAAAVYAQIAGTYAWFNHTGLFASPDIEDILRKLGSHLISVDSSRQRTTQPREVLHVVTQVYQTGGPTQAIACWIEQDRGRHHRWCITRQGPALVPAKILSRLNTPSDLIRLDTRPGGMLDRAALLRAAAAEADVVLVHSHPYDVLPVIAFAGNSRSPPIIYVNHGDHVFWLGTSMASVVLNLRDSG